MSSWESLPPKCEWAQAVLSALVDPRTRPKVLFGEPRPPTEEIRRRIAALQPGESVVVIASGGQPERMEQREPLRTRFHFAAQLAIATTRARLAAAKTRRTMREAGLATTRIDIGPAENGYPLSIGKGRVWPAVEIVLAATRSGSNSSPLNQAIARAGQELDRQLVVERGRVLSTGTLMVELSTRSQDRWFLRLGDPGMRPSLLAHADPVELLLASQPPETVRRRLIVPDARGLVGPLAWSVEGKRPGRRPRRLTRVLWDECVGFLTSLASVAVPPTETPRSLGEEAAILAPYAGADKGSRLEEIARRAEEELHDVPRRWGHGDFGPSNLLVSDGQLGTVLDWDYASPTAFAGLDLINLQATTDPVLRLLSHGERCTRLAASLPHGNPRRLWAELKGAGVPTRPSALVALTRAYWLTRAAQLVRVFPDPSGRVGWLELNLRRPLAEIGQPATG